MRNNRIVMAGCHKGGFESISELLKAGLKLDYFVLIDEELANRNNVSGYIDFIPLAKEYDIPVYFAESYSLKSEKDIQFFKENKFDLLVQGGWQRLFPEAILKTLTIGAIGVHGSSEFLPRGRGRSPLNWSLILGKDRFILHYFLIKPGVDDGDVFHAARFDINDWDNINSLYLKLAMVNKQVLLDWIPKLISGNFNLHPQLGEPTYYSKRTEEDGKIDFASQSMKEIYNFVRAQTKPYPGAFAFLEGKKIRIWRCQPFDTLLDNSSHRLGEVLKVSIEGFLVVKVIDGLILVTDYEYEETIQSGAILK